MQNNIMTMEKAILTLTLFCVIWISWSTALPRPYYDETLEEVNCGGEMGQPLITPCKNAIKLDAQTNYTLQCEADEPVEWIFNYEVLQAVVPFANTEDPSRPYGLQLLLLEVSFREVGAYYCIKKSAVRYGDVQINMKTEDLIESVNSNNASSIYVYVNDPNNLLADTPPIVKARQYTEVIIPCKPSMPETEVILSFNGDNSDRDEIHSHALEQSHYAFYNVSRYNDKFGFILYIVNAPPTPILCVSKINRTKLPMTVYFDEANRRLNKPIITSTSPRGHVYYNESFELVCQISAPPQTTIDIEWRMPRGFDQSRAKIVKPDIAEHSKNNTHKTASSILTVVHAEESDTGAYKCIVKDETGEEFSSFKIKVMEPKSSYLDVREPSNHYNVREIANKTIQMTAIFEGFPEPTFKWYKPNGMEIWETESNFKIISTELSTTLQLLNAQLENSGTYKLKGTNGVNSKQLEFNVSVISGPVLNMEDVYVQEGHQAHLNCTVMSYPTAIVTFLFKPCKLEPRWPTCHNLPQQNFSFQRTTRPGALSVEFIHEITFTPTEPGILSCVAQNLVNNNPVTRMSKAHVLLGDISENMTIYGLDLTKKIAKGEKESITCEALAYHFDGNLLWYQNGQPISETDDLKITESTTKYSYKSTIHFNPIRDKDSGTYQCRAQHIVQSYEYESREIDVFVHDPQSPQWEYTNLNAKSKIERNLGESLSLECRSKAIPEATVHWYKDDTELHETNLTHILENNSQLLITHLYPKHDGLYRCVVENRLGKIENSVTVVIANMPGIKKTWIWLVVFFFGALIALCAFLAVRYRQERKRHLELKAAGLANFEEGAVEHINPALSLDEQADLLPYNREFEFPREKLKLGKQLGAGAFGVVLKGEAEGISHENAVTIVAVKMVKRTADNEVVRALVSELKIMVHLGQHLNVVNLLGAVTKNIAKRELMVIVEYCRFGNVQNFLLRNRKCYINQINPTNDRIDPTIMTQRISDNFELHRDGGLKYANVGFPNHSYINHMNSVNNNYTQTHRRNSENDPRSGTRAGRPGSAGYSYDRQMDTCATEATVMTTVPEDDHVMSNNSIQPAWRSNYKTDSTEAMSVTTSDLVSWAFQVARGMDYLSSKKVLHGDLAARNILLCEDNVVKICDFGLARSMYRGDNYKKSESAKLPIKWLALESLSDQVFSTYSDVWSFGIVLWELFSLAKVPYPGIDPNQELFNKLNDGYRMEKPPYANGELYEIMLECWRKSPESRPLFNELERRFASMLTEDVANHYLDLNNPYMQSNMQYMKTQPTDYLALMGSPDEPAPERPRYVNGHMVPDIRIEEFPDDYQEPSTVSGTAIFSPTRLESDENAVKFTDFPDFSSKQTNETSSFTFPDTVRQQHSPTLSNNMDGGAHKPLRKKNGLPTVDGADRAPEEIPMLHRSSNSEEGDQSNNSPAQQRRFPQALKQQYVTPTPSPRHHVETKLNGDNENYVNVKPPRKNLAKTPATGTATDAFSNPSYQPLSKVNEKEERRY
ncbi:vascular endothelial growth factor receptor 3 isoform X5 [Drosophila willistoni]|uniref:vascular endothelial growth factor receptor 3 isoform X5 n=1 Tax=Drosophila willistoni TaxID=7260 RepID=UPI001F081913|nr:vascular endothelial growth factor receptor 3 isoform X5 [Drosophila willistoni]